MSAGRKIMTSWVGRLKERADPIDQQMVGKTAIVLLHYRVGRLTKVSIADEVIDADMLVSDAHSGEGD